MEDLEKLVQSVILTQSVDMTEVQDFNIIRNEIIQREFSREIRRNTRSLEQDYFPYK